MRALLFGTTPESVPPSETDNRNLKMLASTPMGIVEMDDPGFLRPDWVVTKPRLTGICGSESKQVFFDYASFTDPERAGKGNTSNPMPLSWNSRGTRRPAPPTCTTNGTSRSASAAHVG